MLNWGNSSCSFPRTPVGAQAATAAPLFEEGWRWLSSWGAAGAFPAPLLWWCKVTRKAVCNSLLFVPPSPLPMLDPSYHLTVFWISQFSYWFNIITTLKWSGSTFVGVEKFKRYQCSHWSLGALDSDLACERGSHVCVRRVGASTFLVPCIVGRLKQSWKKLEPQRQKIPFCIKDT